MRTNKFQKLDIRKIMDDIRPNENIQKEKILAILKTAYFKKVARLDKFGEYIIEVRSALS
jgi:hypothetical protein